MAIGIAYGSSPPPTEISSRGSKKGFKALSQTVGTTEVVLTIPQAALSYQIRVNGKQILTLSDVAGGTAAPATSVTLPKFNTWSEDGLNLDSDLSVYLKSDAANTVVELVYWFS